MKARYRILFALVYTLVYLYLAVQMLGAGHGTAVFLAPVLTWFFLFIALFLLSKLDNSQARIFFIVLLLAHYGVSLLFLQGYSFETDEGLVRMWGHFPYFVSFTILWYVLGQIFIWANFFREIRKYAGRLD